MGKYYTADVENGPTAREAEDALYAEVVERIELIPSLKQHEDMLLMDRPDMLAHLQWVATAPQADLVEWATLQESIANAKDCYADGTRRDM